MTGRPRILGVAGPAGSGKTALVRSLTGRVDGAVSIFFDDFPVEMPDDLPAWLVRGAEFDEWRAPELAAALADLVESDAPTIVFEAPLGRAHEETGSCIDALVFIDVPPEVALARFVQRESGSPEFLAGYLSMYETVLRPVYEEQRRQVLGGSDLIIDGLQPIDVLVEEALIFVEGASG